MRLNVPFTGFLMGVFLPVIGLLLVYVAWGSGEGFFEFMGSVTRQKGLAAKVLTMGILINLIPFVYFNYKRLDYAMRGVVVATMLYAVLIVLIKFVW